MSKENEKNRFYNFFDAFKVKVECADEKILDFFDSEFYGFESEPLKSVDLKLVLSCPHVPEREEFVFLNNPETSKLFQGGSKNKNFYFDERLKLLLKDFFNNIEIHSDSSNWQWKHIFVYNNLLENFFLVKAIKKNLGFLHSACLSLNEKGFLFPAWKSTGKTSLAFFLTAAGMDFLSDELTVLKEGTAFHYPSRVKIEEHVLYNLKTFSNKKGFRKINEKLIGKSLNQVFLSRIPFVRKKFSKFVRVNIEELFHGLKTKNFVKVDKVLFLLKSKVREPQLFRDDLREETLNIIKAMNTYEITYRASVYWNWASRFNFINPKEFSLYNFTHIVDKNNKLIEKNLKDAELYQVKIPFGKFSISYAEKMWELIKEIA